VLHSAAIIFNGLVIPIRTQPDHSPDQGADMNKPLIIAASAAITLALAACGQQGSNTTPKTTSSTTTTTTTPATPAPAPAPAPTPAPSSDASKSGTMAPPPSSTTSSTTTTTEKDAAKK
jgi:hypothetical protein